MKIYVVAVEYSMYDGLIYISFHRTVWSAKQGLARAYADEEYDYAFDGGDWCGEPPLRIIEIEVEE